MADGLAREVMDRFFRLVRSLVGYHQVVIDHNLISLYQRIHSMTDGLVREVKDRFFRLAQSQIGGHQVVIDHNLISLSESEKRTHERRHICWQ